MCTGKKPILSYINDATLIEFMIFLLDLSRFGLVLHRIKTIMTMEQAKQPLESRKINFNI